jgi:hypothetical protein
VAFSGRGFIQLIEPLSSVMCSPLINILNTSSRRLGSLSVQCRALTLRSQPIRIQYIELFLVVTGVSWASGSMATGARCCRTDRVSCERFLWSGRPSPGICIWCSWARIGYSRNSRDRPVRLEEEHRVQIRLVPIQFYVWIMTLIYTSH